MPRTPRVYSSPAEKRKLLPSDLRLALDATHSANARGDCSAAVKGLLSIASINGEARGLGFQVGPNAAVEAVQRSVLQRCLRSAPGLDGARSRSRRRRG